MREFKEVQRLERLAVLENHNLGFNPTYNQLMKAQFEEKNNDNLRVIFEKQKEYLNADIEYIKGKRKELQSDANQIKYMQNGGYSFEITGMTLHIFQVIRTLIEKFNHKDLYLGYRPYHIDAQLFYLNDNYNIEFFDGYVNVEIHTHGDACDSFKETYDISVENLKAHIKQSEFLSKEEKEYYSIF